MTNFFFTQQWFILLLGFGILAFFVWRRWRDLRWIKTHFANQQAVVQSFGVQYFGRATEPGEPRRHPGFLLLFPDKLFFRSPTANMNLTIPVFTIRRVYHATSHKGVDLHRSLMMLDFLTKHGQEDTVAFAVPYPPQWMQAIEKSLGINPQAQS
jgi:hypothetical protein